MTERPLDPDALAALEEQRDFLLRSLSDLEREHDAGDLSDDDFDELRDDYTARAAEVLRAIDDHHGALADARPRRSVGRTLAIAAAVAAFALAAGLALAGAFGAREAGESASGGITVSKTTSQRANECNAQVNTDPDAAFACFQDVLEDDPENPVALTWSAWQLSRAAPTAEPTERAQLQALAAVRLDRAVASDPDYSYARAFRAVVAYRNGRYAEAAQYLDEFEARNPSADAVAVIEQMDLRANIEDALAQQAGTTTTTAPGG